MRLVLAARFLDTAETLVAASALRASGIFCFIQNEATGQAFFTHQLAFGGYGIWVLDEDLEDVRAFIGANRGVTPSLSHIWPSAGVLQTFLALILWFYGGTFVPLRFGPASIRANDDDEDVNSPTTLAT